MNWSRHWTLLLLLVLLLTMSVPKNAVSFIWSTSPSNIPSRHQQTTSEIKFNLAKMKNQNSGGGSNMDLLSSSALKLAANHSEDHAKDSSTSTTSSSVSITDRIHKQCFIRHDDYSTLRCPRIELYYKAFLRRLPSAPKRKHYIVQVGANKGFTAATLLPLFMRKRKTKLHQFAADDEHAVQNKPHVEKKLLEELDEFGFTKEPVVVMAGLGNPEERDDFQRITSGAAERRQRVQLPDQQLLQGRDKNPLANKVPEYVRTARDVWANVRFWLEDKSWYSNPPPPYCGACSECSWEEVPLTTKERDYVRKTTNFPVEIHLFEPTPKHALFLNSIFRPYHENDGHYQVNSFVQIGVHQAVVSDEDRAEVLIEDVAFGVERATVIDPEVNQQKQPWHRKKTSPVKQVRLDNFLAASLSSIDLLIVDVEGLDWSVLRGAEHFLKKKEVGILIFELHRPKDEQRKTDFENENVNPASLSSSSTPPDEMNQTFFENLQKKREREDNLALAYQAKNKTINDPLYKNFLWLENFGYYCFFPVYYKTPVAADAPGNLPQFVPVGSQCWLKVFENFWGWTNVVCVKEDWPKVVELFLDERYAPELWTENPY